MEEGRAGRNHYGPNTTPVPHSSPCPFVALRFMIFTEKSSQQSVKTLMLVSIVSNNLAVKNLVVVAACPDCLWCSEVKQF